MGRMMVTRVGVASLFAGMLMAMAPVCSLSGQEIATEEYELRRARLMEALPEGIVVLHARSLEKAMEQWGFVQDASFAYFSGLANLPQAVLALDGPAKQALLFLPPRPQSFGFDVEGVVPEPGPTTARALGVARVEPWDRLIPYLQGRAADGVTRIYVDVARRPEPRGAPPAMNRISGDRALWRLALERALPDADFASAEEAIRALRWVKSPTEIEILRRNALYTVRAFEAGARRIEPFIRQRQAEAAVVAACIEAGAEGPSFWPWMMAGPNGHVGRLVGAFFDYHQLDRTMRPGEVVRVDIGCGAQGYGADVGRTIPVSGVFSDGQREAWDLLIDAYRAGMGAIRGGVTVAQVMAAARAEIVQAESGLRTEMGREAARVLLAEGGMGLWSIHGVGVDSGETALPVLEVGSVIAFEPMFSVGADAFYLEDMILVTQTGHEVLSAGLPYSAVEIEALMTLGR